METKEQIFTRLYLDSFPVVAKYVSQHGGSLEEAKDIFQQALMLYYEKVIRDGFQPEKSHAAYVIGVAKKQWLKYAGKHVELEPVEELLVEEETSHTPITEKLLSFLQEAGEKCMSLLQSFYYEKLSMKELTDRFGYSSERSATVQKFKCLEKVRESVKEKSLEYADFVD